MDMLFLQKTDTGDSFEVTWIYDRGDQGFFLRVDEAKNKLSVGDKVVISQYNPKLEKQINTTITHVETNTINQNVCIRLRNKRDIPYFKEALARLEP